MRNKQRLFEKQTTFGTSHHSSPAPGGVGVARDGRPRPSRGAGAGRRRAADRCRLRGDAGPNAFARPRRAPRGPESRTVGILPAGPLRRERRSAGAPLGRRAPRARAQSRAGRAGGRARGRARGHGGARRAPLGAASFRELSRDFTISRTRGARTGTRGDGARRPRARAATRARSLAADVQARPRRARLETIGVRHARVAGSCPRRARAEARAARSPRRRRPRRRETRELQARTLPSRTQARTTANPGRVGGGTRRDVFERVRQIRPNGTYATTRRATLATRKKITRPSPTVSTTTATGAPSFRTARSRPRRWTRPKTSKTS